MAQTHIHEATPLCSTLLGACSGDCGLPSREKGGDARGRGAGHGGWVRWPWWLQGGGGGEKQLGCCVGPVGRGLSRVEQAGSGGSRLCLHLPRTPGPRSPLIPGASPTPGRTAQPAHLQLRPQEVGILRRGLLCRRLRGLGCSFLSPLSPSRCRGWAQRPQKAESFSPPHFLGKSCCLGMGAGKPRGGGGGEGSCRLTYQEGGD